MELLQFEPGYLLIRQGDREDWAYIIESGSVKIMVEENGKEQILGIAGMGEVVGEIALFEENPRSANVITLEPTQVRRVSREELVQLMQTDAEACVPFFKAILERLRTTNSMLVAAQQTRDLIKTVRIKLTFEPISEIAVQIFPQKTFLEMDVLPSTKTTQIQIQGLQQHFKVNIESFLPGMSR